ncbi:hypothetical protein M378DRAFT_26210 [Amanita muscaria Koide BX008]|uniref:C2H2-type domain-containing protein n=1 Tax=Amanita muscaria (strain Koide BX008) TaxID=946122 RepID=A0A0C2WXM3_AMAMK|nr:hypothetical protein M378DRAFT_26210 [Amanita muscaria Koide BX008]
MRLYYDCADCNRSFFTNRGLLAHCEAKGHEYYKCELCDTDDGDIVFMNKHELDEHMEDHHEECEICETVFVDYDALCEHDCFTPGDAYCQQCDRHFKDESARNQHYQDSPARVDTRILNMIRSITQHYQSAAVHHDINCFECGQVFDDEEKKDRHDETYCHHCERRFPDKSAREQHYQHAAVHRDKYCSKCQRLFDDEDEKNLHDETYCHECEWQFEDASAREEHYQDSDVHRDSYCFECEQLFDDEDERERHDETYCHECKRQFRDESAREQHYQNAPVHQGSYCFEYERPLSVEDQDDKERNESAKEEPIPMTLADYFSFLDTDQNILEQQRTSPRIHYTLSGSRRTFGNLQPLHQDSEPEASHNQYERTFADYSPTLQQHYRGSAAHWTICCTQCNRYFPDESARVQHYRTSTSHSDNYCLECDELFLDKSERQQHYRAAHRNSYCYHCELYFCDERSKEQHYRSSATHRDTYCHLCDRFFRDKKTREEHYYSDVHRDSYCEQCKRLFQDQEAREQHYCASATHHDSYCKECNQFFGDNDARELHYRISPAHRNSFSETGSVENRRSLVAVS